MTCAFSGHRPGKLPWGTEESDPRCRALKQKLLLSVQSLADSGYDRFLCGMARGCDQYFFDAVRETRLSHPDIRLVAVIPCPSQPDSWPTFDRLRYEEALTAADETVLRSDHYYPGCMLDRNRWMVDRSQLLLTVWDGSDGGTASAVAYARRKGVALMPLWR